VQREYMTMGVEKVIGCGLHAFQRKKKKKVKCGCRHVLNVGVCTCAKRGCRHILEHVIHASEKVRHALEKVRHVLGKVMRYTLFFSNPLFYFFPSFFK